MSQPTKAQRREEMLRQAVNAANHGLPPGAPVLDAPAASAATVGAEGIFDRKSLYAPQAARCEWYTMPGGGRVCVHPVSLEEAAYLNRQALKEVHQQGLVPKDDEPAEVQRQKAREAQLDATARAQAWQVVLCCRAGEDPRSAKVFDAGDVEALRRNPGFVVAVQEICALSDRLSQGQSEAALLKERLADFFGAMGSWLGTWCSQLSADTLDASKATLMDFANSVSAMKQPGASSPASLADLIRSLE